MRPVLTRLPLEPLERAIGSTFYSIEGRTGGFIRHTGNMQKAVEVGPIQTIARLAGVSRRTATRWKVGGIDIWNADRVATLAGFHPAELWPEWFEVTENIGESA